MDLNKISGEILDSAMRVHKELGPGLLESAYESCLKYELIKRGLQADSQVEVPVRYDGKLLGFGYRMDLLVENEVVVELKTVDRLLPIHEAQLLSYLKLADKRLGVLINFNVNRIKDGFRRIANRMPEDRLSEQQISYN